MKAALLLCFVAAASAQYIQPALYNSFYHGAPASHYSFNIPKYHAQSAGVQHTVYKREAEAESYYGYPYAGYGASSYYSPRTYTSGSYLSRPFSSIYGNRHFYKREAEADPLTIHKTSGIYPGYSTLGYTGFTGYNGYVNSPFMYNSYGMSHLGKREADPQMFYNQMHYAAKPMVYNTPYLFQQQYMPVHAKTYSNDAVSHHQYAAKGQYVAKTAGSIHLAKREADPLTIYKGFNTMPYSYSSLGYPTTSHLGYNTLGYSQMPISSYYY